MMPTLPDIATLQPQQLTLANGNTLNLFASDGIEMFKLDIAFEAGSAYQPQLLCAAAANQLVTEGSSRHTAQQLAEWLDFRGIVVEKSPDTFTSTVTVYAMPKYAAELFPLLLEILTEPAYSDDEFRIYANKRRQQLLTNFQKTDFVARKLFYTNLFGPKNILGACATPADIDSLTADAVRRFHSQRYHLGNATLALAGKFNQQTINAFDATFGSIEPVGGLSRLSSPEPDSTITGVANAVVDGAAQTTVRVGRILPMCWDSVDYARFLLLNTVLGGYFGSRLMSNIREDKGYTYGIYSQTRIFRGSLVFYITADVDSAHADDTLNEIRREMQRLQTEPVPDAELDIVRNYMAGDFLRTIDGIFERSERYMNLVANDIDETLARNLFAAIADATPADLMQLARTVLDFDRMTITLAGPGKK